MTTSPETLTLLHIDDDPDFLEVTATCLEREDSQMTVHTAPSAADGLAVLSDIDVDCIVSDYEMPEQNGLDFLDSVREEDSTLPFILYTGKGSEEVASDAISAGVTDYLQKESGTDQYTILANRVRNAVTARRSAADAHRRRHRLEQILKTVPSCVVQLDSEGHFVFANERAVEVLGLQESSLADRGYNDPEWNIRDLDGEPIPDSELPFQQVRESGEVLYGFRHTIEWPDGTRKILSINGAPLFDDDGTVERVVFSLTDITEQVEREAQLEETTARLEALFEQSPDMINIHDSAGNIVDPNSQLCELTGYSRAELTEMKVWELDQNAEAEEAMPIWDAMDNGDSHRLDSVYRRRDGSTFQVEIHVRHLNLEGEDCFVAISRDVSEREARERELKRQNEQLEEFASVISHDLRNPLTVADLRLELVQAEYESEHLDAIERAHDRMAEMIADLLTLAREGEEADDITAVELSTLAQNCWGTVDTRDCTLVVESTQTIRADRSRLSQLFENLIANAIDHGGPDVTVTVGDLSDGFYIEDDGAGIDPEIRDTVFDIGFSTGDAGTGFGLGIVQQVVDAHDWDIAVTDGSDGSARFEITGVDVETA